MKTFSKAIGTILSVSSIMIGLTALFTIDNAQGITSLLMYVALMIIGIAGGIYLLIYIYPELTDLSEFEEETNSILGDTISILEDYEREIDELREENLLLIDRYITFKSIIKSSNAIDESNKEKYANLYHLIYEEDLVGEKIKLQEPSLDELDRFKEIYN